MKLLMVLGSLSFFNLFADLGLESYSVDYQMGSPCNGYWRYNSGTNAAYGYLCSSGGTISFPMADARSVQQIINDLERRIAALEAQRVECIKK